MAEDPAQKARVVLDEPTRQNLLGLLLRNLLETNLADDATWEKVRRLEGDVEVGAGQMTVTLRFAPERLTILSGPSERPRASVRGEMPALLAVAGGGGMVGPVVRGELRPGGNPLVLLKLLPLFRPPGPPKTEER